MALKNKVEPRICASGLARRQALYYPIECRGIFVDKKLLLQAQVTVAKEIEAQLKIASDQWGKRLYVGAENGIEARARQAVREGKISKEELKIAIDGQKAQELNIRSPNAFLQFLKDIGYKIPKITKKDNEGEYSQEESTSELALRKLIMENQFKYPDGDKGLIAVLQARELITLDSRYLKAKLFPKDGGEVFLSSYNAGSGTLTGRRASKKHFYGYGGNGQNIPSHSQTAELFRNALVARPGFIFLHVDLISAEDWPVSALAQNHTALAELLSGADRHTKLAAFIFGLPIDSKTKKEWKESTERYLGKKTRHANNYGMKPPRMHDSLMQEGKYFPVDLCASLLTRANEADPNIKGVFHKYIYDEINRCRILKNPFGRERQFLGFRPGQISGNLFNEALAWIPQSTVGDNTGFAVETLQLNPERNIHIVQEGHDSIIQEVEFNGSPASVYTLCRALERTVDAFDRPIVYHNGITTNIPVEAEISWNLGKKVKIHTLDQKGIEAALAELGARPCTQDLNL